MNDVFLIQTDTTAGFCSKNYERINRLKGREAKTPCILTLCSLRDFKKNARVYPIHKSKIRRAKKTSFILSNKSYRIINESCPYKDFLRKKGAMYSSSANITKKKFCEKQAKNMVDIVVYLKNTKLCEKKPSSLIKLGKRRIKKLR